ncbi:MAG: ACT domain-containing protein [Candidatus Omnitrophica bacterium]|nr:ACT domain-containing protein [Candidatus Omnitrophota bacterium]MBU4488155.1 ACT domain-containing protein [Candidatus Omnitrophota bacterium]MCG2704542.1 ACT domain-containing protein [Candidatus Omnitrophota bacterium]
MAKATIVKELIVKTPNRVGMLAEVAGTIAKSGANINALNAFGVESDAIFRIVTSDNAAAIKELKAKKIEVSEKDAVKVELENKSGMAAEIAEKLKAASIDIKYIYGSACGCTCPCGLILNTSDNKKTVDILNK